MPMRALIGIALLSFVAGCGHKIEVQSNTSWTGNVNGGSVSGSGTRSYDLKGDNKCFVFQKETEGGSLRVKFKKGTGDEPSTTAAYGVVSGCAD